MTTYEINKSTVQKKTVMMYATLSADGVDYGMMSAVISADYPLGKFEYTPIIRQMHEEHKEEAIQAFTEFVQSALSEVTDSDTDEAEFEATAMEASATGVALADTPTAVSDVGGVDVAEKATAEDIVEI